MVDSVMVDDLTHASVEEDVTGQYDVECIGVPRRYVQ
jgi:hypothetical protein